MADGHVSDDGGGDDKPQNTLNYPPIIIQFIQLCESKNWQIGTIASKEDFCKKFYPTANKLMELHCRYKRVDSFGNVKPLGGYSAKGICRLIDEAWATWQHVETYFDEKQNKQMHILKERIKQQPFKYYCQHMSDDKMKGVEVLINFLNVEFRPGQSVEDDIDLKACDYCKPFQINKIQSPDSVPTTKDEVLFPPLVSAAVSPSKDEVPVPSSASTSKDENLPPPALSQELPKTVKIPGYLWLKDDKFMINIESGTKMPVCSGISLLAKCSSIIETEQYLNYLMFQHCKNAGVSTLDIDTMRKLFMEAIAKF